jgi:predicted RNase H-like HicB family nuclease
LAGPVAVIGITSARTQITEEGVRDQGSGNAMCGADHRSQSVATGSETSQQPEVRVKKERESNCRYFAYHPQTPPHGLRPVRGGPGEERLGPRALRMTAPILPRISGTGHRRRITFMAAYRIVLRQSEEGFAVSYPGLPGCWSQGASEEEALANIRIAIREYAGASAELAGNGGRIAECP